MGSQFLSMKFRLIILYSWFWLLPIFTAHGQNDTTVIQTGINSLSVSGMANFIAFYRDMRHTYPGTTDGGKSWAFTPYPSSNNFNGNFSQQPFLSVNVAARPTTTTSFSVDYTLSHLFTGADSSKNTTVQNLLQFQGNVDSKWGSFQLRAGGGSMEYNLSPLTMFNKDFREPAFERLPWEWRMRSFDIYEDDFHNSDATAAANIYNSVVQGYIFEGQDLPYNLGFSTFYGRSNSTVSPNGAFEGQPLQLFAGRLYKVLGHEEQLGVNYYKQFGFTNTVEKIRDEREIITASYDLKNESIHVHGEAGLGRLDNPVSNERWGEAIDLSLTLLNEARKMPLRIQYYRIHKNVAALESAVLNANSAVQQGGYGSDRTYENSLYPAYLQEVGMLANNRQGIILHIDKSFDLLKIGLGYTLSQELENDFQGVSYQHMVNAFPRSRFQPWVYGAGPYGRVANRYRRSFETIAITDGSTALKSFNAFDLSLKSKFQVAGRNLILMNFLYYGNVGNQLSPFDTKYLSNVYEEIAAYYNVREKINVLLFYSYQRAQGGEGTATTANGGHLDQRGHGYGFGLDFDIMKNAGMYVRHRWMEQNDPNFSEDKFKGTETTIELKYYF